MARAVRRARAAGVLGVAAAFTLCIGITAARSAAPCQTIVTAGTGTACPGVASLAVQHLTPVTWCYQVRNTGDVVLSGITVVDSVFGALAGTAGDVAPGDTSVPLAISGEAMLGRHTAQAMASAGERKLTCAAGEVEVVQVAPGITLDVSAAIEGECPGRDTPVVQPGTDITFCYVVGNPDLVTSLRSVQVTDDQFGPEPIGIIATLAPGASQTLKVAGPMLSHDRTSFVSASGVPVLGEQDFEPVRARASLVVHVR